MIDDFPFGVRAGTWIASTFEHHFFQEQYADTVHKYNQHVYVYLSYRIVRMYFRGMFLPSGALAANSLL